jgi:hypothetical protein
MPGPVSESSKGPDPETPYVPSWCYDPPGPRLCACGHHEGFHNDAGQCLQARICKCKGFKGPEGDREGM